MRRATFLKSLAAMAAAGTLPLTAFAAANVKMMIPANPGGGWDSTGRALGKAILAQPFDFLHEAKSPRACHLANVRVLGKINRH